MNRPRANSRVSPGRNGKNSPHSTKMITMLTQRKASPNSLSSQSGSSHLIPKSMGSTNGARSGSNVTAQCYVANLHVG